MNTLGFQPFFQQQLNTIDLPYTEVGRVVIEHKHSYRVMTAEGDLLATVSGKFAHAAYLREHYPAVGDFVLVQRMPGEERAIIHHLFERKSLFTRKVAGKQLEKQIVAANVDTVFLTMSLNDDFNVRRMERYLVAAWDSGAMPVIVLTKADLCDTVASYIDELALVAIGVDIIVVSAVTQQGIDKLANYTKAGETIALLGSSGAGKSTLVNTLLGEAAMETGGIREDDAKGRHTTTHRELLPLPTGAFIIDTPGMRELNLYDQNDSLAAAFEDIEEYFTQCRYRDCQHKKEPGCAIQQALQTGELTADRYASYQKLQRELAFLAQKEKKQERALQKVVERRMRKFKG